MSDEFGNLTPEELAALAAKKAANAGSTTKTNKGSKTQTKTEEPKTESTNTKGSEKTEGADKIDKTSIVEAIKKKSDSGTLGKTTLELNAPTSGSVDAIANDLAEAAKEAVKDDVRDMEITVTVEGVEPSSEGGDFKTEEESSNFWDKTQEFVESIFNNSDRGIEEPPLDISQYPQVLSLDPFAGAGSYRDLSDYYFSQVDHAWNYNGEKYRDENYKTLLEVIHELEENVYDRNQSPIISDTPYVDNWRYYLESL